VTAAHVTWRPLGALLVEKGLLTAEELEDALAAQQTTGKRLGQILVDRGHVSGPALTNALAEQYGIELKTEEGFGTGLRAEIERRHTTRRPPAAAEEGVVAEPPAEPPVETEPSDENGHGDAALAELEPQLEEHWARLAAAEAELAARDARIAELEAELDAMKRRLHQSHSNGSAAEHVRRLEEVIAEQDKALRALEEALQAREAPEAFEESGDRELALETRAAELAKQERELAEQEQALEGRQRGILTAAADLEQRRRLLEERERFAAPEIAPAPRPDVHSWSLDTLTRLVDEHADDFPERADEWRYTLFYLRNEAEVDGTLPSRFDALVDECFGELLGGQPAAAALAR
jgi:DNA repair exonuclease SbcCD ATPase subunit